MTVVHIFSFIMKAKTWTDGALQAPTRVKPADQGFPSLRCLSC